MEALDDLLSDTDCEGYARPGGHFSFLALSKGLSKQAALAPFEEDEDEEAGAWESAGLARPWPAGPGSTAAGSACSGEGDGQDSDGGSCPRRPGRNLWDVSALGLGGSQELGELEEDVGDAFGRSGGLGGSLQGRPAELGAGPAGADSDEAEEAGDMQLLPSRSRIRDPAWDLDDFPVGNGSELSKACSAIGAGQSSTSTPRSSDLGPVDLPYGAEHSCSPSSAATSRPEMSVPVREAWNPEDLPISASGSYGLQGVASTTATVAPADLPIKASGGYGLQGMANVAAAAAPTPSRGRSASQTSAASESAATTPTAKPRPFLKKGARMPRSDVPHNSGEAPVTRAIVNPTPKKQLRLRPRASSAVSGDGKEEEDLADAFPARSQPERGTSTGSRGSLRGKLQPRPAASEAFADGADDDDLAGFSSARLQPDRQAGSRGSSASAVRRPSAAGPESGSLSQFSNMGLQEEQTPPASQGWQASRPSLYSKPEQPSAMGLGAGLPIDEWGDTEAWDWREDVSVPKVEPVGDVPTSPVVRSYFHSAVPSRGTPTPQPSGVQSGGATPSRARPSPRLDAQKAEEEASPKEQRDRQELWRALEKEREDLKRQQAKAAQAERDVMRERHKLLQEVESERQALHAEFDAERTAIKKERRRLGQGAERQRQQLAEDREMLEERRRLQERSEQLEEELREKDRRWQRTVDRLQRQITDLTKKNQELQEEVRRANWEAQQRSAATPAEPLRRSSSVASTASARGRRSSTPKMTAATTPPSATPSVGGTLGSWRGSLGPNKAGTQRPSSAVRTSKSPRSVLAACGLGVPDGSEGAEAPAANKQAGLEDGRSATSSPVAADAPNAGLREVRNADGRIERVYADGRREVEFANGLRKVMWTDGHSSVLFQNGDQKEIHADGTIVYHYSATGAVQTTLPDGSDLFHFSDGQFEQHNPDGSKEIKFPNGTTKHVLADGSEEVCFVDGTIRRTPAGKG